VGGASVIGSGMPGILVSGMKCPVTNPPAKEPSATTIMTRITKMYFKVLSKTASNSYFLEKDTIQGLTFAEFFIRFV
jgi:hypothetical protein